MHLMRSSETYGSPQLEAALDHLQHVTARIRAFGLLVLFTTAINLGAAFVALMIFASMRRGFYDFNYEGYIAVALPIMAFTLVLALGTAAWYDQLKRSGNALFEEISDELEWHVRATHYEVSEQQSFRAPMLSTRLTLREFAKTTELPLFPGPQGAGVYAIVDLAIFAAAAITIIISS